MLYQNFLQLLFAVVLLIMSGCASNKIYRSDFQACSVSPHDSCDLHSLQIYNTGSKNEFMLGFVEVDDQGQLRDRRQMQALINALYQKAVRDSLLVNVFVHGWHHNAAPGDANIESFKKSLAKLSSIESELSKKLNRPARKIVGVYVGWRGESITVPAINMLTFWERKNTAQEVGYLGVTELLLKLEEISNVKNSLLPPIKSRLVILGHSFGGAVVYSATTQILANRFIDSQEGKTYTGTAKGFGDLVVLLNPAFEALRYTPLYDMAQGRCSYFDTQVPRLAILTSEADNATRLAFPIGRFFTTFFETHEAIQRSDCKHKLILDEGAADRKTVGHFLPLISHTLKPAEKEALLPEATYSNMKNIWSTQTPKGSTRFGTAVLTHQGNTDPRNPYLNIRVDEELISDHNDIFGSRVMDFIRLLIELSTSE